MPLRTKAEILAYVKKHPNVDRMSGYLLPRQKWDPKPGEESMSESERMEKYLKDVIAATGVRREDFVPFHGLHDQYMCIPVIKTWDRRYKPGPELIPKIKRFLDVDCEPLWYFMDIHEFEPVDEEQNSRSTSRGANRRFRFTDPLATEPDPL